MSKNIVDTILQINQPLFALLPSRRQIDYDGGYVNNWDTFSFLKYVRDFSNIKIERDHGGIGQNESDHIKSFLMDAECFDLIHIDPWKKFNNIKEGIEETVNNIKMIHKVAPNVKFEVGTEEAIREFSLYELNFFLKSLQESLTSEEFNSIEYVCIQSGVGLDTVNRKNIGTFSIDKLKTMTNLVSEYGLFSKEHNGDYLSENEIKIRFKEGLTSINIGPEIVQIETETYLNHMNEKQIDEFYKICLDSKKWVKWVNKDFDINNKTHVIMVAGHYCYDLYDLPKVSDTVKINLKNKFQNLIDYVS